MKSNRQNTEDANLEAALEKINSFWKSKNIYLLFQKYCESQGKELKLKKHIYSDSSGSKVYNPVINIRKDFFYVGISSEKGHGRDLQFTIAFVKYLSGYYDSLADINGIEQPPVKAIDPNDPYTAMAEYLLSFLASGL